MCLITIGQAGNAQQGAINLQKKVVVPANNIKLDSLLRLIKKQTGAKFSINTRKFPASKYIRLKKNTPTIAGLLQEIKQNTGVYYAVLGDHIILLDNPPPAKRKENNAHSPHVSHISKKPSSLPKRSVTNKKVVTPDKNTKQSVIKLPDTANGKPVLVNNPAPVVDTIPVITTIDPVSSQPLAIDTLKPVIDTTANQNTVKNPRQIRKRSTTNNNQPTTTNKSKKEKQPFTRDLFAKPGITVDDLFYFNPTIQLGLPYLYGIASWSSNFNVSMFRYGVGGSVPLSDQWKLHLQLTTGKLLAKWDTAGERYEFKTRLHRAALIGEVKLNSRFSIQFGPVLNIMKLTFYRNGEMKAPGFTAAFVDQRFDLLKPIYTIKDTYSVNAAQSTKSWIGFQAGIFYNINFFDPK
ncbi:hypothetical protein FAM09_25920 [Niastella caeni]|uniref:Uncharacterized protein n=1 Tax=Niastella caeni TaxID=2569763 RepID=A0A4S8HIW4_9BACT|nr:hypothetical protein [Niastella caeni]THU33584.1 hypothetical protein FAM09_25920 [Niastella caeni]